MKKVIISTIILFCCILFYKNADAAVVFDMNSDTVIDDIIYAVKSDTGSEIQIKNMISVTIGQSFELAQVCNIDDILEAGGNVNIKNCNNLVDFTGEYTYNPDAVSIEDEKYKINVENNGISVLEITVKIDNGEYIVYFAVNGIDGSVDIYNNIESICAVSGINNVDDIDNFETAYDIYIGYLEISRLIEKNAISDTDMSIQHDGKINVWKITNNEKYLKAYRLLAKYFETKSFSLQEVQFISEFEGIVLRFAHEVSEDDMLAYAFYNKQEYVPDAGITLSAAIQNIEGTVYSASEFTVYKDESEIVLKLDDELKEDGIYSVELSGIGNYTSKAEFSFNFIFNSVNKGAFINKKTAIYSGIYNGEQIATAKAKRRYHCIAKSSVGWYRIKLLDGSIGYIEKNNASLSDSSINSIVNIYDTKYSYADMKRDIKKMSQFYQDVMKLSVLTSTADNNNIYCARLGNENANKKVLIQSTMHAREWLNSQLVMKMLERCCRYYYSGKYGGVLYSKLFDNVCFYIIPMLNPDGVNISQYGLSGIKSTSLKRLVKRFGKGRYSRWKANARGVDLNRNFSVGFRKDTAKGTKRGSEGYSGSYAASEKETKAIIKLINNITPKAVINYHEAGRVIYYTKASSLLSTIKRQTGYRTIRESISGANGSFGDYLTKKGIAWCTPETCVGLAPVNHSQFYYEWGKHRDMIPAIAKLYR